MAATHESAVVKRVDECTVLVPSMPFVFSAVPLRDAVPHDEWEEQQRAKAAAEKAERERVEREAREAEERRATSERDALGGEDMRSKHVSGAHGRARRLSLRLVSHGRARMCACAQSSASSCIRR